MASDKQKATLGGGCFWCLEAVYEQLEGVHRVVSGYAGGHVDDPTYEQVCSGSTGHAEVVQVTFDPKVISYEDLLDVFFTIHDPTTKDRQGPDKGSQYRSIVLTHDPTQREAAESKIRALDDEDLFDDAIVTEVQSLQTFYPAEAYHQGFYRRNPGQGYCQAIVKPKLAKFRKKWQDRLKADPPTPR